MAQPRCGIEPLPGDGRRAAVDLRDPLCCRLPALMAIFVHRYTLGPRRGALIRVNGGFPDVHPWPELGDAPPDDQLALLEREETTPLTRASLHCARVDGEARTRGVSLFDGLTIPLSHW